MNRLKFWFPCLLLGAVVTVTVASNWPHESASVPLRRSAHAVCQPCGMEVSPADALRADIGGVTHYFCGPRCRDKALAGPDRPGRHAGNHPDRPTDRVCNMEVNTAWGIQSVYDGSTYYFCTRRCKELFDQNPEPFLQAKCLVCQSPLVGKETCTATYLGKTYALCSAEHRAEFKRDPAAFFMHTMWGIPTWLYYGSIALVLLVSFGLFDWTGRKAESSPRRKPGESKPRRPMRFDRDSIRGQGERWIAQPDGSRNVPSGPAVALPVIAAGARPAAGHVTRTTAASSDRFDLLSVRWIRTALRSRVFRFALQALVAAIFILIIAAGLFGNQNPAMNIAPLLTWTVWWGLLIVLILFAGKAWCYVCPWDAIAGWTERLSLWKKSDDGLSLGLRWPRVARNILIATVLFVGLTWIELGFGVTMKPRVTAYLAVAMLLMAVVSAMLFDRKSFCRYGCLVGRVSGLYALFAGVELRPRSGATCSGCRTKECVKGSETAYGCPTFLYPGKLETNTYCIQCMECVQACPHDNLALNLRPWGSDLATEGKPRADEAYLALLMLAITGFHGLTMTPAWQQLIDAIRYVGDLGRILGFSIGMALLMLGPIVVYAALVAVSKRLGQQHTVAPLTYRDYFVRYAYALLPIALFYHIAHNLEHLLMEGPKIVTLASDPFGWGWNLLGTASWTMPPMISLDKLWLIQAFLVLVGHVYSLWVAQKTSLRLFGSARAAFRGQLPMLAGMIAFSVLSLWLLKQPMEMRTSAM